MDAFLFMPKKNNRVKHNQSGPGEKLQGKKRGKLSPAKWRERDIIWDVRECSGKIRSRYALPSRNPFRYLFAFIVVRYFRLCVRSVSALASE